MSSTLSNMKSAVQATMAAYNARDYDALRATRSDDFIYYYLPSTLNLGSKNNEEYAEYFKNSLTPTFTKFVATPITTVHDPEARKSVLYGKVDVESVAGADTIEIMMMLTFDEAGEKVTRVEEFFDSLAMTQIFAKVHAAHAGETTAEE